MQFEEHYRSAHTNQCSLCRRCLPSLRLLDIHITEKHDSYFKAAVDLFHRELDRFNVKRLPHESWRAYASRLDELSKEREVVDGRQCRVRPLFRCIVEGCSTQSYSDALRMKHLVHDHHYPPSFSVDGIGSNISERPASKSSTGEAPQERKKIDRREILCRYFLTSSGCAHGNACPYKHDTSAVMKKKSPALESQTIAVPHGRVHVPRKISFGHR